MSERRALTANRLRKMLDYDPLTGVFRWRVANSNRVKVGDYAGCVHDDGYWKIRIDGRLYRSHRLAWLYAYSEWPDRIDHVDGNRTNNRLDNLRWVTPQQNALNQSLRRDNVARLKGVTRSDSSRGHFQARITVDGKRLHLGTFPTAEEAHAAYCAAALVLHGEYARTK